MRFVLSPFAFIRTACLSALFPVLLLAQDFSDKTITHPMDKGLNLLISVGVIISFISCVGLLIKAMLSEDRARWYWAAFGSIIIGSILGNIRGIMAWFS